MYKQGVVYIWQGATGRYAYLNGTETTVISGPNTSSPFMKPHWETDTFYKGRSDEGARMMAYAGDLREKKPPSGEDTVFSMFRNKDTNLVKHEPNEVFEDEVTYYFRTIWNEPAN